MSMIRDQIGRDKVLSLILIITITTLFSDNFKLKDKIVSKFLLEMKKINHKSVCAQ